MAFPSLNIPNVSSFLIIVIVGEISRIIATAAKVTHDTQGEKFVKNIVDGQKKSQMPQYLLFTAPYRLCEGGCNKNVSNYELVFPLYVGRKGKEEYKKVYQRDFKILHSSKSNAPFKKKTTRHPFTLCNNNIKSTNSND